MEISRTLSPQPQDKPKASTVTIKENPEQEKRKAEREAEKEKRKENAKSKTSHLALPISSPNISFRACADPSSYDREEATATAKEAYPLV